MADKREACLSSLCKHATEDYQCNHREEEDGVYQTGGGEREKEEHSNKEMRERN